MTGQREGLIGDIFKKVKDLVTDDDNTNPTPPPPAPEPTPAPQPGPPVTPQCCGHTPKFAGTAEELTSDEPIVHDANCPNHPDNLAKEVMV
ncbi:hypothetical protein [Lentzea aerocolonigenes]|uniref:hypothetical protein n=1 Tax=Lentzea aerocolonigenes TaxID=68170 RepID=UPI0004C31B6E|nr:hypothetical protein [Lentzea aerocolonigenes]MCP2247019.1 hypothetical protein [Lentzea aerocolonigenes]